MNSYYHNPYTHSRKDVVEYIDIDLLAEATKGAVNAVFYLADDRSEPLNVRCDFNGDAKTDILWRHGGTGEVGTWLMDGTTYMQYVYLGYASDLNWEMVGPK